ncbi:winged helix DNA-binding domain-containing protein [Nocardioides maradonensis]
MTPAEIARRRIHAHGLAAPSPATAEEIVGRLVAMQAQDYRGGLWSVGARSDHLTEADVETALAERRIVRTWPMRGTLHLVAAADARWLPALLGPRASQAAAGRRRGLGLDDASVALVRDAWEAALTGGQTLGRPELFKVMDAAGVDSGDQRGPHLLRYFAEQGVLCFGPHAGKQPTYALIEEWCPDARVLDREEALAELALRYFTGHGPATIDDFAGWAFLTKGDARAGLAAVGAQLDSAEVAGLTYWYADGPDAPSGTQLLAGFDEYVLGYKNRSAFLTPEIFDAVVPGGNGVFRATVVDDGQVVGLWTARRLTRRQVVTVTGFEGRKPPRPAALKAALGRYADFCGVPTELG